MITGEIKHIYLAGGCFWGTEHYFKQIEGVVKTEVGFANGHTENPTYEEVYTDTTGYAETVHVGYRPDVVSLEFLLQMFFKAIDPTSLNKQGHDEGTRYRTGIYYTDPEDLPIIEQAYREEQSKYLEELLHSRGVPPGLPRQEPRRLLPPAAVAVRVRAQSQGEEMRAQEDICVARSFYGTPGGCDAVLLATENPHCTHFFQRIIAILTHFFQRIIATPAHFFQRIIASLPHFFQRILFSEDVIDNHDCRPQHS